MRVTLCDNSTEWNHNVLRLDGTLYHSWQWGELRRYHGWEPWRILVREGVEVRAAVQVLEKRISRFPPAILYARRGIACRNEDVQAVRESVEWLRSFLSDRNAILLRIDPEVLDADENRKEVLTSLGFRSVPDEWSWWGNLPRGNMVLNIGRPEEELLRGMRTTHRQLILRAAKSGLEWDQGTEVRKLGELYQLLLHTGDRKGFYVRSFDYFSQIRRTLLIGGKEDNGIVILARYRGKPVAGCMCVRFGSTCHWLYGGFDWGLRHIQANEALQWKAIQWAKSMGCLWYDMGAASTTYPPKEHKPGFGVYNFKKGLGAELRYYSGYYDLVGNSVGYKLFRAWETQAGPQAYNFLKGIRLITRHVSGGWPTLRKALARQ